MMKDGMPIRRVILRGVLAVACGLAIPATIFGCAPKADENPNSPAATGTEPAAPEKPNRVLRASARYRAGPKG